MYTFEDWLNGKIGYKEGPPNQIINEVMFLAEGKLEKLCSENKISENCVRKIRQCQEQTFDRAYVLQKESYIAELEEILKKAESRYIADIVKYEVKKWKDELNPNKTSKFSYSDPDALKVKIIRTKRGIKDYYYIRGKEYKEVLTQYEQYKKGEKFYPASPDSTLYKIKAILEYLEYLKNFFNPRQVDKGLNSTLSVDALKKIYRIATQTKYIQCSEENFLAAFSSNTLPENFQPIRWMVAADRGKTIGDANISALRDFISVCVIGKVHKKNLPRDVSKLFVDRKYKGIELLKPLSGGKSSAYAKDFEDMLSQD